VKDYFVKINEEVDGALATLNSIGQRLQTEVNAVKESMSPFDDSGTMITDDFAE
jgi:hypothetical protein